MRGSQKVKKEGAVALHSALGKLTASGGKRLGATFAFVAAGATVAAAYLSYLV